MIRFVSVCVIIAGLLFSVIDTNASEITGIGYRIEQLRAQIESQIEKIRAAREQADSTVAVGQVRAVEQLVRSEEDLSRQIESLQQFRDQLRDQMRESQAEVHQVAKDWNSLFRQAFADIDAQLLETRGMLNRVNDVKRQVATDCAQDNSCGTAGQTVAPLIETTAAQRESVVSPASYVPEPPAPPPAPAVPPLATGG